MAGQARGGNWAAKLQNELGRDAPKSAEQTTDARRPNKWRIALAPLAQKQALGRSALGLETTLRGILGPRGSEKMEWFGTTHLTYMHDLKQCGDTPPAFSLDELAENYGALVPRTQEPRTASVYLTLRPETPASPALIGFALPRQPPENKQLYGECRQLRRVAGKKAVTSQLTIPVAAVVEPNAALMRYLETQSHQQGNIDIPLGALCVAPSVAYPILKATPPLETSMMDMHPAQIV